jgi:hypothetical protein
MLLTWPAKQQTETRTYGVDWSSRLNGAFISSVLFTVINGSVAIVAQSFTNTIASATVSGGINGECAELLCHIVDSNGIKYDAPITLAIRDWGDLGDQASTTTKRQIIEMAFEECGLPGYSFDASADEMSSAIRRLDALMAIDEISGMRLGYNFPAGIGKSDPDNMTGIPDYAVLAIAGQLASRIAPGLGKKLSQDQVRAFGQSFTNLQAKSLCIKEVLWPSGTPSGAGNKSTLASSYMRNDADIVECC